MYRDSDVWRARALLDNARLYSHTLAARRATSRRVTSSTFQLLAKTETFVRQPLVVGRKHLRV